MGKHGEGSIEQHKGRWRVRFRIDGRLRTVASKPTEAEAEQARDAFLAENAASATPLLGGGTTLLTHGELFLKRREVRGGRDTKNDETTWRKHIATADFAAWPITDVTRRDVERWLDKMLTRRVGYVAKSPKSGRGTARSKKWRARNARALSISRIKNALNLLRQGFEQAVSDGLLAANPAQHVRVPDRAEGEETTEDAWDWMRWDEQQKFAACEDVPLWARCLVMFAIGTGLRKREQWNLELRDVHDGANMRDTPHIVVRFGAKGRRRKTAKARETHRVDLFGWAMWALERWRPLLEKRRNPHGLLWPTPTGERWDRWGPRSNGKDLLARWLQAAGIARELRWHDLRHTAGSSLVSGVWGRPWALLAVRDFLDHKSIKTTERYAHLATSVVTSEAQETARLFPGPKGETGSSPNVPPVPPESSKNP